MANMDELNLEEMENVSGGAGNGNVESDGTVATISGPDTYQVDIGGRTVTAYLSGKMRMNYVRVMPGDRVRVEYDPDKGRGRITYRYR